MFDQDRLCLYYHYEYDVTRMLLADTVIPWASEWLLHYEIWLATGTWHGGGHGSQHGGGDSNNERQAGDVDTNLVVDIR